MIDILTNDDNFYLCTVYPVELYNNLLWKMMARKTKCNYVLEILIYYNRIFFSQMIYRALSLIMFYLQFDAFEKMDFEVWGVDFFSQLLIEEYN